MDLKDVIVTSSTLNGDLVLYAKKIEGQLSPASEAVLLELTDEEQEIDTSELAARRCPGFSYCMEMFLIQEFIEDLNTMPEYVDIGKKVDRVIYYIENDA